MSPRTYSIACVIFHLPFCCTSIHSGKPTFQQLLQIIKDRYYQPVDNHHRCKGFQKTQVGRAFHLCHRHNLGDTQRERQRRLLDDVHKVVGQSRHRYPHRLRQHDVAFSSVSCVCAPQAVSRVSDKVNSNANKPFNFIKNSPLSCLFLSIP